MEYRSPNEEKSHFGGDLVAGVNNARGVMLSSNTVQAVGDAAAVDLYLLPKGTGKVYQGAAGSTVSLSLVTGESTATVPNMPANSQAVTTMAAAGISTGDLIIACDARNALSTGVTLSRAYPSGANEISLVFINPHASSIAAESTGITIRWAYLDRT